MYILFHCTFLFLICQIKCQQAIIEHLAISTKKAGDKVNIRRTNIERRFIEDLDDDEWHVAHLRGDVLDGRRNCMSDTFQDKVRRYRKMLKEDGARVDYVSSKALPVNPDDLVPETCKVIDDLYYVRNISLSTIKITSANFGYPTTGAQNNNVTKKVTSTQFIDPTSGAPNVTLAVNTTKDPKTEETTPKLDFKATTVEPKVKPKKKKLGDKREPDKNDTRRASEYMFSSVEYYDESIEFDNNMCPDAVEIIELEIDQLRSYDLECEMTVEWRSLE